MSHHDGLNASSRQISWVRSSPRVLGLRAKIFAQSALKLGLPAAYSLMRARVRLRSNARPARPVSPATTTIRIKGHPHPIHYRQGTSDVHAVRQIFQLEEYECVTDDKNVEFIVDCGANIGCTSAYLLARYPIASLIAVEPDAGNAAICRLNLAPFGHRAQVIQAGLWPVDARLKVERGNYRDGMEWSFQVRACAEDEEFDVPGISLTSLLGHSPSRRLDLVKIDIEGSEREVFSDPSAADWIALTRTIAIELHDQECREIFSQAIARFPFATSESGELMIARREIATSTS